MTVTVTLNVDGETLKDSRDLALALIAAAADIDHGATLPDRFAEYASINLHGRKVGQILFDPVRPSLVNLPARPSTRLIYAGELKPDFTIIEAGRALKVGNVRHTPDGYTYYSVRALTGEPFTKDDVCTLSIARITVEAR